MRKTITSLIAVAILATSAVASNRVWEDIPYPEPISKQACTVITAKRAAIYGKMWAKVVLNTPEIRITETEADKLGNLASEASMGECSRFPNALQSVMQNFETFQVTTKMMQGMPKRGAYEKALREDTPDAKELVRMLNKKSDEVINTAYKIGAGVIGALWSSK